VPLGFGQEELSKQHSPKAGIRPADSRQPLLLRQGCELPEVADCRLMFLLKFLLVPFKDGGKDLESRVETCRPGLFLLPGEKLLSTEGAEGQKMLRGGRSPRDKARSKSRVMWMSVKRTSPRHAFPRFYTRLR
jgi:hypothetical protein